MNSHYIEEYEAATPLIASILWGDKTERNEVIKQVEALNNQISAKNTLLNLSIDEGLIITPAFSIAADIIEEASLQYLESRDTVQFYEVEKYLNSTIDAYQFPSTWKIDWNQFLDYHFAYTGDRGEEMIGASTDEKDPGKILLPPPSQNRVNTKDKGFAGGTFSEKSSDVKPFDGKLSSKKPAEDESLGESSEKKSSREELSEPEKEASEKEASEEESSEEESSDEESEEEETEEESSEEESSDEESEEEETEEESSEEESSDEESEEESSEEESEEEETEEKYSEEEESEYEASEEKYSEEEESEYEASEESSEEEESEYEASEESSEEEESEKEFDEESDEEPYFDEGVKINKESISGQDSLPDKDSLVSDRAGVSFTKSVDPATSLSSWKKSVSLSSIRQNAQQEFGFFLAEGFVLGRLASPFDNMVIVGFTCQNSQTARLRPREKYDDQLKASSGEEVSYRGKSKIKGIGLVAWEAENWGDSVAVIFPVEGADYPLTFLWVHWENGEWTWESRDFFRTFLKDLSSFEVDVLIYHIATSQEASYQEKMKGRRPNFPVPQ
ncbi:hypothetical protein N7532_001428 [Penicillium argentinense]|uniref:Uncharacterized protein n=1 Tax=Penicillium argentinense TaxID=1131581 RepID=A0A9W9KMF5_9EURO|nr:uncharacterized protein N7532_001428 [Penicillium argentinense]KAJ5110893.1 hypothetical protein N7532_001428 [Penicillium argentinense]